MSSSERPLVSVVMPVYNAARYLPETIDSILRQTFTDFEFIIVDDGSTDDSPAIIDRYAKLDKRIKVKHQANRGLVATLNATIKSAKGPYIARVDGDDPSFEDRLEKQVAVLQNDPDIVLVGGGFEIIDEAGHYMETIHAVTRDEDLRRALMVRNPFGHAGVLFRKETALAVGLYSGNHGPTEDYDLWIRMSEKGLVAALPQPTYRYRIVSSGISQSNSDLQTKYTKQLSDALWKKKQPRVLSRKEILTQANRYIRQAPRPSYGIGVKEQFLYDNAYLATKFLRHGQVSASLRQTLAIASIGRSGLRAVKRRTLGFNYVDYLRRRVKGRD